MTYKFPDFTSMFDTHSRKACPNKFCRIHYYWDFELENHIPLPNEWNILTSTWGWINSRVFVGPPAWLPKKPTKDQLSDMKHHCPHAQADLTCNYCMRHTFRPLEIR